MQTEAFSAIGNGPFPAAAVKGTRARHLTPFSLQTRTYWPSFNGREKWSVPDREISSPDKGYEEVGRVQIVAWVPRMTELCDDSTPPLPCAIAVSQSVIWRAPHSRRSCRDASINRNNPYMPGWQ